MEELPACLKFDNKDFITHLNTIESAAKKFCHNNFYNIIQTTQLIIQRE